jgi:hypothetical protein
VAPLVGSSPENGPGRVLLPFLTRQRSRFRETGEIHKTSADTTDTVAKRNFGASGEIRTLKHLFLRQGAIPIRTRLSSNKLTTRLCAPRFVCANVFGLATVQYPIALQSIMYIAHKFTLENRFSLDSLISMVVTVLRCAN